MRTRDLAQGQWGMEAEAGAADSRSRSRSRARLVGVLAGNSALEGDQVLREPTGRVGGRPSLCGGVQGAMINQGASTRIKWLKVQRLCVYDA
jgi:hypothetical protein